MGHVCTQMGWQGRVICTRHRPGPSRRTALADRIGSVAAAVEDKSALLLDVREAADAVPAAVQTLRNAVDAARSAGATWTEIAGALGVSRQAAWERFAKGVGSTGR